MTLICRPFGRHLQVGSDQLDRLMADASDKHGFAYVSFRTGPAASRQIFHNHLAYILDNLPDEDATQLIAGEFDLQMEDDTTNLNRQVVLRSLAFLDKGKSWAVPTPGVVGGQPLNRLDFIADDIWQFYQGHPQQGGGADEGRSVLLGLGVILNAMRKALTRAAGSTVVVRAGYGAEYADVWSRVMFGLCQPIRGTVEFNHPLDKAAGRPEHWGSW